MAYTLHGANGGKRSKISDFLVRWSNRPRRQSAEDQLTVFRAMASRGGRDGHDS